MVYVYVIKYNMLISIVRYLNICLAKVNDKKERDEKRISSSDWFNFH